MRDEIEGFAAAIYCGVPAAMEATRAAEGALTALGVIVPRSAEPSET